MRQELLSPLMDLMWKSRGRFQDYVREQIKHAIEAEQYSQQIENLLRLTSALRAGGHIPEDLNNE
ncbi:MAG: hypothetical protein IPP57_04150 [Candidatus Obscuribacter sp.]|jgi:hypothetical protein|nr:hypothetical protein [Candidatus Obscuribacter sp.]MBK9770013.1 hypothetical protein [Candidatus Obscuribacter sp.]